MQEIRSIIKLYDEFRASGTACALATVVNVAGSSYRRIGARLLVGADGRFVGGISGGCLEGDALERAQRAIYRGEASLNVYDTTDGEDKVIGIGLGCNGRIDVRFVPLDLAEPENQVEILRSLLGIREPVVLYQDILSKKDELRVADTNLHPNWIAETLAYRRSRVFEKRYLLEWLRPELRLVVAGDNYDIKFLAEQARQLGWEVTIIGTRRKFTRELSEVAQRLLDHAEVEQLSTDAYTAVLCMTHDYHKDLILLRHFLPLRPPYLGLLGPRKRAAKLADDLRNSDGLELLEYPNLFAPVGLDLGAETPAEIAAAIIGEIIGVFRGGVGGSLREKAGAIH